MIKKKKKLNTKLLVKKSHQLLNSKNGCKMFQTILILKSAESLLSFLTIWIDYLLKKLNNYGPLFTLFLQKLALKTFG